MKKQSMIWQGVAVLAAMAFFAACATNGGVGLVEAVPYGAENLVVNYGFEDSNMGVWRVTLDGEPNPPNAYEGEGAGRSMGPDHANPRSGGWGFRWWRPANKPIGLTIEQDITVPASGTYRFSVFITGGNAGANAVIYTYVLVNGTEAGRTAAVASLPGWQNWSNPVIDLVANEGDVVTIGASLNFPNNTAGAWGTLDDVSFFQVSQ